MKRLFLLIAVFVFTVSIFCQEAIPEFVLDKIMSSSSPQWVKEKVLEVSKYSDYNYAYSSLSAWGVGEKVDGKKFYWFAYTNSDAYYQLFFSNNFTESEITEIKKEKDLLNRSYNALDNWLGCSNDWALPEYGAPTQVVWVDTKGYSHFNKEAVTRYYLKKIKGFSFINEIQVAEYF